jgi:hypothetical protein
MPGAPRHEKSATFSGMEKLEDRLTRGDTIAIVALILAALGIAAVLIAPAYPEFGIEWYRFFFWTCITIAVGSAWFLFYHHKLKKWLGIKKLNPFLVASIVAALICAASLTIYAISAARQPAPGSQTEGTKTSVPIKSGPVFLSDIVVSGNLFGAWPIGINGKYNVTADRLRAFVDISPQMYQRWESPVRIKLGEKVDFVKGQHFEIQLANRPPDFEKRPHAFFWGDSASNYPVQYGLTRVRLVFITAGQDEQRYYFLLVRGGDVAGDVPPMPDSAKRIYILPASQSDEWVQEWEKR